MELTTDVGDARSVVGQEAHIVGRSKKGPRGEETPEGDRDGYDNLIVLCPKCHKLIDDHPDQYSSDMLRQRKREHEARVKARLNGHMPNILPTNAPSRFINRTQDIKQLDRWLDAAGPDTLSEIVVLTGLGGVGKSALAATWIKEHWPQFTGGQLTAHFSRTDTGMTDVADVLATFLRQLGVNERDMPSSIEDRQHLFQRQTRDRRMLLYLDDVDTPAQVQVTLPGGPHLVVVTSNHELEELVVDPGARVLPVKPLLVPASVELLEQLLGKSRVSKEAGAAERVARHCGGLPLALCVCAGMLTGRERNRSLTWLADSLEHNPLATLERAGSKRSVTAIFDLAYRGLPENAALAYRRLGLYPGTDFALGSLAALTDTEVVHTTAAIDILRDHHLVEDRDLIQGDGLDRFGMHPLVREHARAKSRIEPTAERDAAAGRLVDWYYAALHRADLALHPTRLRLGPALPVEPIALPHFTDAAAAHRWFATEQQSMPAVIRLAVDTQADDRVWQIAEKLWPFCYESKFYGLWTQAHEAGADAAKATGNSDAEARMRACLSRAYAEQGDLERATNEMQIASRLARDSTNSTLRASVTEFDAILHVDRGQICAALARFDQAHAIFTETCNTRGAAIIDYWRGKCRLQMRGYREAIEPLTQAACVLREGRDYIILARALRRLGEAHLGLQEFPAAKDSFREASFLSGDAGARLDTAHALMGLATAEDHLGDHQDAALHRGEATRIYDEMGHRRPDDVPTVGDMVHVP
jgi:tetratricopeptide (TPR) repeat protein